MICKERLEAVLGESLWKKGKHHMDGLQCHCNTSTGWVMHKTSLLAFFKSSLYMHTEIEIERVSKVSEMTQRNSQN